MLIYKYLASYIFIEIQIVQINTEQRGRRGRQRLDSATNRVQRQGHRRCARNNQASSEKRGEYSLDLCCFVCFTYRNTHSRRQGNRRAEMGLAGIRLGQTLT